MKKSLIIFSLLLFSICVFSQQKMSYAYDAAGNRVKREIVLATKSLSQEELSIFTEEVAKRDLKYYSSAEGQITVEISTLEGMKSGIITISRMDSGAKILSRKIQNTREDMDISSQRFGIYILHVDIDGEITTWKLLKK